MQRLTHWIDGAARAPGRDHWLPVHEPASGRIYAEVAAGNIRSAGFDLNGGWVPNYTQHKVLAGLRDAGAPSGQACEIPDAAAAGPAAPARQIPSLGELEKMSPEELDKLIEWIGASSLPAQQLHEGEHLFAVERLVVSPGAGVFAPNKAIANGARISVGDVIGMVGDQEVRSLFDGILQNYISVDGERLTPHQPVAWLRTI